MRRIGVRPMFQGMMAVFVACGIAANAPAVSIEWSIVGDPGNTDDALPDNASTDDIANNYTYGGVDYVYRISKYEVTNAQYAEFLSSVAGTNDRYGLYHGGMLIEQTGGGTTESPYVYVPFEPEVANFPVQFVDYWDAARFTNWLYNGQTNGDTESGVYSLNGVVDSTSEIPSRNPGATVFLPNEDEWYKAAYYDPTLNEGAGGYWDFATQSNTQPISEPPPGGSNSANYNDFENTDGDPDRSGHAVGGPYYVSDVGSYAGSTSYYGTYDQNGNVWEWVEDSPADIYWATLRGNSWKGGPQDLNSSLTDNYIHFEAGGDNPGPVLAGNSVGFRVAASVGDFNGDRWITTDDLDVMVLGDATFDITGDGVADNHDRTVMVTDLIGTWSGDSNGDGEFNSSDFVQVFTAGKFELQADAVWSEGDWNLDGRFNSSDLVMAFAEGGYEQGPRSGVAAIPEPTSQILILVGFLGIGKFRRE